MPTVCSIVILFISHNREKSTEVNFKTIVFIYTTATQILNKTSSLLPESNREYYVKYAMKRTIKLALLSTSAFIIKHAAPCNYAKQNCFTLQFAKI